MSIKLVVVGDKVNGVKTRLLTTFVNKRYPSEYTPTCFAETVTVMLGYEPYQVFLLDTANSEDYARLRPLAYPQTDVFLVTFSVASPASFENAVEMWVPEIRHHCPNTPFLLVGLETETRDGGMPPLAEDGDELTMPTKFVSKAMGQRAASKLRAAGYFECSALWNRGVKEVFDEAVMAVVVAAEEAAKQEAKEAKAAAKQEAKEAKAAAKAAAKEMVAALARGSLPVQRLKLVLLGRGRAGKTSLLGALMGRPFDAAQVSTVYMELNEVEGIEQHELQAWRTSDTQSQLAKSVHAVRAPVSPPRAPVSPTRASAGQPDAPPQHEAARLVMSAPSERKKAKAPGAARCTIGEFAAGHQAFKKSAAKELVKTLEDVKTSAATATLSVFDFAGQDRYTVFQSLFVTPQAVYVVVLPLPSLCDGDGEAAVAGELRIIMRWLATIRLRAPSSSVFLVATQADELTDATRDAQLAALHTRLDDVLSPAMRPALVLPGDGRLFFVTSARTGAGVDQLRSAIDVAVARDVEVAQPKPVDWICLQDYLAELSRQPMPPLALKFDELLELARRRFHVADAAELQAVLQYYARIGVVMYFPTHPDLRTTVFVNPQGVVNVISTVFRWTDQPPGDHEVLPENRNALHELRRDGLWQQSLLREACARQLDNPDDLPELMALLKAFDMLCDVARKDGSVVSLIPCLLPDRAAQPAWLDAPGGMADLGLSFPQSVLPTGLFHQLVVRLAAQCPRGFVPQVYQHSALVLAGRAEVVLQQDRLHGLIRVRVQLPQQAADFKAAWVELCHAVVGIISEHWSRQCVFVMAPMCPCAAETPHVLAALAGELGFGHAPPAYALHCEQCRQPVPADALRYWFAPPPTSPATAGSSSRSSFAGVEDGHGAIMLSYAWERKDLDTGLFPNQERVKALAAALEQRGFAVWLDVRYMRGDMVERMTTVIGNALAVIACVSPGYHRNPSNAYDEFNYAHDRRKLILGVKLTANAGMTTGAYGLRMGYRHKFYDVSAGTSGPPFEATVDELAADLRAMLAKK